MRTDKPKDVGVCARCRPAVTAVWTDPQKMRPLPLLALLAIFTLIGCGGGEEAPFLRLSRTSSSHLGGHSGVVDNWGSMAIQHEGAPVTLRLWHIDNGSKKRIGTIALDSTVHCLAYLTPALNEKKGTLEFEAASFLRGNVTPGSRQLVSFSIPTPNRLGCSLIGRTKRLTDEAYLFHYWIMEQSDADWRTPGYMTHDAFMKISAQKDVSFVLVDAIPGNQSEQETGDQTPAAGD